MTGEPTAMEHSGAGRSPELAPFERAPTLLTSASSDRGEVRVWSPDMSSLRRDLFLTAVVCGVGSFAIIRIITLLGGPGTLFAWIGCALLSLAMLLIFGASYLRPRYVTTDDEGLAFITGRGSQSLRWREISEASFLLDREIAFRLESGKRVVLCWLGYQPPERTQLRELIIARAQLTTDGVCGVYRRPKECLAPPPEPALDSGANG